jgi:hypothetical protein
MARLAGIVPPPRLHIVRYHGLLASRSRYRRQIVPGRRAAAATGATTTGAAGAAIVPAGQLPSVPAFPVAAATTTVRQRGTHAGHRHRPQRPASAPPPIHPLGRAPRANLAPLPIEVRAIARAPALDEVVEAMLRRLPPWTTTSPVTVRVTRLDL